jgi:hypothetical protein
MVLVLKANRVEPLLRLGAYSDLEHDGRIFEQYCSQIGAGVEIEDGEPRAALVRRLIAYGFVAEERRLRTTRYTLTPVGRVFRNMLQIKGSLEDREKLLWS